MNTILENQKSEDALRALLAQKNAYSKSKRIYWLEAIIIINAIAATIVIPFDANYKETVAIISIFAAIIIIISTSYFGKQTKIGAGLQEVFDVDLYEIEWNKTLTGKRTSLNEQFFQTAGSNMDNIDKCWYSKSILPEVPREMAIILCLKCNSLFGIHQRTLYRNTLITFLSAYYIISIIFCLAFKLELYAFAIMLAPSVPFLNLMINKIKSHTDVYNRYKIIDDIIEDYIVKFNANKTSPTNTELRAIQDLIYLNRLIPVKIPNWFYKRLNKKSNYIVDECIASIVKGFKLDKR